MAKLPVAWKDRAYRAALRHGTAVAPVVAVSEAVQPDLTDALVGIVLGKADFDVEAGQSGSDTDAFPWN